jgi:hypothetical protein
MEQASLRRGLHVAYRQGRKAETPLHEVVLVDGKLRGRTVEVIFVAGGVRMFVHQARLVCLWSKRKSFLRHEARRERLREDWIEKYDSAIDSAMHSVLKATAESTGATFGWTEPMHVFERLWPRAGLEGAPWKHELAFKGDGYATLPWDVLLEFCLAFCAREPAIVLSVVEERRQAFEAQARMPGDSAYYTTLRLCGPGDALIQQWCGGEKERELMRKEEQRLRGVINIAIDLLRAAGDEKGQQRIERALRGR